jgi:hypothetical protein
MSKVGMICVSGNVVESKLSHNGGWTLVCKNILRQKFNTNVDVVNDPKDYINYDILVINEGVNYKEGKFNFFGGVQQLTIDKLHALNYFKGSLYCINEEFDLNLLCSKRKELNKFVDFNFKKPEVIKTNEGSDKLILGDSHSISVYKPGYSISRNDGKTLHGFLKKGLKSYLNDSVKELVFYAGNIDVRFHIGRQMNSSNSIENLCFRLENQLKDLKLNKVSIVGLLPTEDESRKIPKTGQYKGQNFFESRVERQYYVRHFHRCFKEMCERNNWTFLKWDFDYQKELSFDDMESRQSVHLRPMSYMFKSDLIEKKFNTLF